ncbi:MAG: hypothetical protein K2P81_16085 [Bacteriovoracaceae bacterium]|nr:hypothetical protein [Bacteriovoracaceae bacterium]
MKTFLSMAIIFFSVFDALACVGGKGFLPDNHLYIGVTDEKGNRTIDESEFNDALDKVEAVYASEVARFGGRLVVTRKWNDGTVNAYAHREGSNFVIDMYGGLARHSAITKDAMTLVACHEIGHHIGGAPRYTTQQGMNWAATEGQSDYFATSKCMRKVFLRENNEAIVKQMKIDSLVAKKCEEKHPEPNEAAICKRISMAGLSGASMFAVMQNQAMPKFETPDPSIVQVTYESHPAFQCRLDTYFNGAVCDVSANDDFNQNDPKIGACNGDFGFRPLCWFKPTGGGNPNPNPNPNPTPNGVAPTPTVQGQTTVVTNNPNQIIPIEIDVSGISGATGIAIEVSKPNQQFANPNGTSADRANGLFAQVFQKTRGTYKLAPAKQLPNWGTYQIRVIALDAKTNPVSKNSNVLTLNLRK